MPQGPMGFLFHCVCREGWMETLKRRIKYFGFRKNPFMPVGYLDLQHWKWLVLLFPPLVGSCLGLGGGSPRNKWPEAIFQQFLLKEDHWPFPLWVWRKNGGGGCIIQCPFWMKRRRKIEWIWIMKSRCWMEERRIIAHSHRGVYKFSGHKSGNIKQQCQWFWAWACLA